VGAYNVFHNDSLSSMDAAEQDIQLEDRALQNKKLMIFHRTDIYLCMISIDYFFFGYYSKCNITIK